MAERYSPCKVGVLNGFCMVCNVICVKHLSSAEPAANWRTLVDIYINIVINSTPIENSCKTLNKLGDCRLHYTTLLLAANCSYTFCSTSNNHLVLIKNTVGCLYLSSSPNVTLPVHHYYLATPAAVNIVNIKLSSFNIYVLFFLF